MTLFFHPSRSSRWRKRMMLFCLGLMWICTKQLRLRRNPPLKYGSSTFYHIQTPLSTHTHNRMNLGILHIWHVWIGLGKECPSLHREGACRAIWCLQRSAGGSKSWALSWWRRWTLCSAGRSPKRARLQLSGVRTHAEKSPGWVLCFT